VKFITSLPPLTSLPSHTRKVAPPRPAIRTRLLPPIPIVPHRPRNVIQGTHRRHIGIPLGIRVLERLAPRRDIRQLRHGILLRFEDGAALNRAGVCVGLYVDADGIAGDEAVADESDGTGGACEFWGSGRWRHDLRVPAVEIRGGEVVVLVYD
jgi:hypothetical protein